MTQKNKAIVSIVGLIIPASLLYLSFLSTLENEKHVQEMASLMEKIEVNSVSYNEANLTVTINCTKGSNDATVCALTDIIIRNFQKQLEIIPSPSNLIINLPTILKLQL